MEGQYALSQLHTINKLPGNAELQITNGLLKCQLIAAKCRSKRYTRGNYVCKASNWLLVSNISSRTFQQYGSHAKFVYPRTLPHYTRILIAG